MLRGVQSDTPFATKFSLSMVFLVLSLLSLATYRIKGGKNFVWPWYKEVKFNGDGDRVGLIFSRTQLIMLILGGLCEFMISLFVILAFNAALKANIN